MENNNYKKITFELQLVSDNLTIKKYLEKIVEVEKESFFNPWSKKEIERELEVPYSFNSIILVNREFGGYLFSHIIGEEANLNKLCIIKKIRKKGIGSYFLKNFLKELKDKGVKKIFLEVRSSNIDAINLYKKYGFIINRVRKNYYNDNEDAYEMKLDI
ncbi:MAG: ribosomal protein S18-alanine N-acetyltransferase [Chitinispirillaceae bacterium]|nr:ribosomal protein S18-alanine N-acetyltransferase [Chitinispirillaceae bacterium]